MKKRKIEKSQNFIKKNMSSKTLQTFLTLLRKQPVQASSVVSFLESGDNSSMLSLDSLVGVLKSLGDENISNEIVQIMERQVQLIINQKKEEIEERMNHAIVENSFTNYSEVVTSAIQDNSDRSVISNYQGQQTGTTLEYYVLHCPTTAATFSLGDLEIRINPISPIPFTGKDGKQKMVSYKFVVNITRPNDPVSVEKEFMRVKTEAIYNLIGMSFLKSSNVSIVKNSTLITMELDTFPFFESLASKYDSYFSNLKQSDGTKLSEISEIETCQIDSNGLILVPHLFYLSSIYTDGHLDGRPYIWAPNRAVNPIKLQINKYRISVGPGKGMSKQDINDAIFSLCSRLLEVGISVSSVAPREDTNSKSISLNIEGYNNCSEDGGSYQSDISSKLNIEARVSAGFRKLCRQGYLGINDFLSFGTRGGTGSEKYTFVYNRNTKTIEASYDRTPDKFMIYFNRSAITSPIDEDGNPTELVQAIIDRNAAKFTCTNVMLDTLAHNDGLLPYGDQGYPAVPGDYIPTSFIPIFFEKKDKKNGTFVNNSYLGISFIPFGFAKYVSIDSNISTADSALAIYGSDISMEPVSVRRVLKLSNKSDKIANIFQIIIEASDVPIFEGDQPLLSTRIDDTHFLSLFRSTNKVNPITGNKWVYASNYVEDLNIEALEKGNTNTLSLVLNPNNRIQISKRAMLRYATESLGSNTEFNKVVLNNTDIIFGTDDVVDLDVFCRLFTSKNDEIDNHLELSSIPVRFFELLEVAAKQGIVNDSVTSSIMAMTNVSDTSVSNFIRSIQNPVKRNDYPVFTTEMQTAITSNMNREIEDVTITIYNVTNILNDKTGLQIHNLASGYNGLLRVAIELIGKQIGNNVSTQTSITNAKNVVIEYLSSNAMKPILPRLIGHMIDIDFIKTASANLSSEVFIRLIKSINDELSADSYEDILTVFLQRGTIIDTDFVITTISPYRYTITFDSSLNSNVLAINGEILPELNMEVFITDERLITYEFGKQIYDHNIHTMFDLTSFVKRSINDLITETLQQGSIYYSQIDGTKLKTDLSLISLYGVPEVDDNGMIKSAKFFLPFNHNGARLTVDKTRWDSLNSEDIKTAEYNLLTKTVEVEFISETDQPDVVRAAISDFLLLTPNNLTPIRSVVLGIPIVKRTYIREGVESHFFFVSDISSDLQSGAYDLKSVDNSIISNTVWERFIGDEVEINIYPISPVICKYNFDEKVSSVLINAFGNKLKLPKKETSNVYDLFKENIKSEFEDQFMSYGNVRSTMLITRNRRGIYTTALGSLDVEARIAKGNVPYNPEQAKLNMTDVDELTSLNDDAIRSIEERILQGQIDLENSKRDEENVKHNLGLILSTIRWNTKQIENYRFINNESPKWIRFSNDSYFMAIAFQSGVKIYIASGDQFIFCSNLPHEGVSEITFGNNNLCVTTQYNASDKPFSKLWIPASGIHLKQELDFYTIFDGDAANIKYISGTTNKEKKSQKISVVQEIVKEKKLDEFGRETNGTIEKIAEKIFYGSIKVESATPIFNHNIYFFSPDDKYMLFNKAGSFLVLSLNDIENKEKKYVKFETFNGIELNDKSIPVKPIESGTWVTKSIFMGFSYSENNPLIKTRVILNIDAKTVVQSDMIPDFPTMVTSETMLLDSYTKIHPLFTYLMAEKEKYLDVVTQKAGHDGIWLWDLYFSMVKKSGITYLNFHTIDGLHSTCNINDILITQIGTNQLIPDYLTMISKFIEFEWFEDEFGTPHVQKMTLMDKVLFDRSISERSESIILQCIDGNYFAFHEDSIYIWSYRREKYKTSHREYEKIWTELSHIDSKGYERMTFENYHVAILIGSIPNAAIFRGDQLQIRNINLSDNVSFDKNPSDVSAIIKPIREVFETDYLVSTEVTFETYSNADIPNPVTLDSRVVSSAMCLNRFSDYTTKSHVESNNTEFFTSHDNLLISCNGNTVKIIPKTVPIASSLDGLTTEWYKTQRDDSIEFWQSKYDEIQKYINGAQTRIPQLARKRPNLKLNYSYIKEIMGSRTSSNFETGLSELKDQRLRMLDVDDNFIEYIIDLFRKIFSIMKNVSFITYPDNLINAVFDYWSVNSSTKVFASLMKSIPEDNKREMYNKYITLFSELAGDNFISYNNGYAFKKLFELQFRSGIGGRKIAQTVAEVRKIVDSQFENISKGSKDIHELESIEMMQYALSIPFINFQVVNVVTYSDYNTRLNALKDELKRVESMMKKNTRYDLYHALEKSQLEARFREFLIKKLTITTKLEETQTETDFINCLTARYETIPKPETISFGNREIVNYDDLVLVNAYGTITHIPLTPEEIENNVSDDKFVYTDGENVNAISSETYRVLYMKDVIRDVYNAIYEFLKEKAFNILKSGFSISTILGIIDLRNTKRDETEFDAYAKQFMPFIEKKLSVLYQIEDIKIGIKDFGKTLVLINDGIKSFATIDNLYDLLVDIFNKRFPDSLYDLYNEIPANILRIIETNKEKISEDSDRDLLNTNIPHIEQFYKFYESSLKRGYYLNDDSYSKDMDDIKKRLFPLIWKYRQGVSDDRVPVVGLKLIFKNKVEFNEVVSHKQREADDLIFNYTMDSDKVKHGEKYGQVKINLVDIISNFEDRTIPSTDSSKFSYKWDNAIMRKDGSTNFGDRIKKTDIYHAVEGIKYDCSIIQDAVDKDIISEERAIRLINNELPPIDFDNRNTSRIYIESVSQYRDLLDGTYRMTRNADKMTREESEAPLNYINNRYNSRIHLATMSTPTIYKFNYIRPGLEFDNADISMIYEDKPSKVVNETVDLSRKNINIGSVRPYFYEPRLLTTEDGKPFIYKDDSDESYIIWYGNTMVGELTRAYLVTQRLSDRSMKTYHYVRYKTGNNTKLREEAHAMKLFFNYKNNEKEEDRKFELQSYINHIKIMDNGDIIYNEKVEDRKHVKGVGHIDIIVDAQSNGHIASFLNSWILQETMDEKKFSSVIITSLETKTHGNKTITISNYRAGRHIGSIVEVFEIIDNKIILTANWNFYMYTIKTFDFNDKELFLVGTVYAVDGVTVRIGVMNLTKRISEKNAMFINVFDREIDIINDHITDIINATCDSKDTTFITYDDGRTSYLVTVNGKASYEKKFNDLQIGSITSVRTSTKNGYVALYFDKIDRTEIWNCDGSLYQIVNGECNWM